MRALLPVSPWGKGTSTGRAVPGQMWFLTWLVSPRTQRGASGRDWAAGLIHQHNKNSCRVRFGSAESSRWVSCEEKGERDRLQGQLSPGEMLHPAAEATSGGFTCTPPAHKLLSIIWTVSSLCRA